jgi:hypothetical protein
MSGEQGPVTLGELPAKWRGEHEKCDIINRTVQYALNRCADELEAALRQTREGGEPLRALQEKFDMDIYRSETHELLELAHRVRGGSSREGISADAACYLEEILQLGPFVRAAGQPEQPREAQAPTERQQADVAAFLAMKSQNRCPEIITKEGDRCLLGAGHSGPHQLELLAALAAAPPSSEEKEPR